MSIIIVISLLAAIISAGIGIFIALYAMGFFQYLGGKKRYPNAASEETLYQSLLSLNNPSKPYHIISGKFDNTDIIAEWKIVDASWYGIFNKNGLKKAYKALLLLDETRKSVRCFEILGTVSWTAGTAGLMPMVHYSKSSFGGRILFQKSYGVGYGVKDLQSPALEKIYEYKFDVNEIRDPIKKTVERLGWEWVPVTAKRHAIISPASEHKNISGVKSGSHCSSCGSQLRPEAKFCTACGEKIGEGKRSSAFGTAKKFILFSSVAALMLFIIFIAAAILTHKDTILLVSSKQLNLRTCPSRECNVIEDLKYGNEVIKTGEKNEWMEVKVQTSNNKGWVSAKYLAQKPLEKPSSEVTPARSSN